MQPIELIQNVPLPEQSIKKLSYCSSNKPQRVADWASYLRPTQFQQTSVMLYQALPETNQLIANAQTRFEILEILRPYVQNTIVGLSKHFLQQPIALPPEAQKSAIIAQALQKHMVDGYVLVIRDSLLNKKSKPHEDEYFATALHRAMTGLGLLLMRSYQIYTQPARGLWLTLHALFRVADQFELLDKRVQDDIQANKKLTSIEHVYMRMVLLASARPHQLGQNDVRAIYDAFVEWSDHVRFDVDLSNDPDCFYYVNLDRDCGPLYKSRSGEDEANDLRIELKLKPLLSQLTKQSRNAIEEVSSSSLKVPKDISQAVLNHLLDVWGNIAQRKQERRNTQITADICVGLSDCHYFLCNGQDFESFLSSSAATSEFENTASRGFTPNDAFGSSDQNTLERSTNRAEVQNVSQGGYCLLWRSDNPIKVQSGDIVGIKEFGKRMWSIGVVRWIRQKKQSSQLGVQTIADKALPYAIAQAYDMGGYSDYMRALFIPSAPFADEPASLLTSSAPFHPMDRVKVLDGDKSFTAKLEEQLFSTSSIQQFSYRNIDSPNQGQPNAAKTNW